jgi:hypothetical protein
VQIACPQIANRDEGDQKWNDLFNVA